MTLDELCRQRVAVWGVGQEGLAVAGLLERRGVVPVLVDDDPGGAARRAGSVLSGSPVVLGPDKVTWSDVDVVVRSPGVSRYRAELVEARRSRVAVTTAMALWLEDFAGAPVVAVTGTKGKSTTAALTAAILGHQVGEVALVGNIGVPVTDLYDRPPADAYVVEVSSYQAADVTVTPRICVLTSLAPDHLSWHGGDREIYYRDKLRLIEAGPPGVVAVNAANQEAVRRTDGHPDRVLYGPAGRVRATPTGAIEVDGVAVVAADRLRVPGRHNVWNLCGAITGALLLSGSSPEAGAVGEVLDGFDGLPSRCHAVGERGGLTFVDDALASNPFATMASVEAFCDRELTLILGGADRGVDVRPLVQALRERRPLPRVVVLAPDGGHVLAALAEPPTGGAATGGAAAAIPVEAVTSIDEAVQTARAGTPPGGVVLFSPAAPTPEGQGGYAQRSRQFIEATGITTGAD